MSFELTLDQFLERNRVASDVWQKADISWEELAQIANDHVAQIRNLQDAAVLLAGVIQRFDDVHSVRWRVKDVEHLLEKIVRRRAKGEEKYADIGVENYYERVTDLVGVRALHLFKNDCFSIDQALREAFPVIEEKPKAYIREGDPQELTGRFRSSGFDVQIHEAGYRSVHYVFSTQPMSRRVFTEVQVRTIFEEGWSEIDHRVRYPNFSKDKLVGYFLTIFNSLAGNADEMGSFVRDLTAELYASNRKLEEARSEKEATLQAMEKTVAELEKTRKKDAASQEQLAALLAEIERLRRAPTFSSIFGPGSQLGEIIASKPVLLPGVITIHDRLSSGGLPSPLLSALTPAASETTSTDRTKAKDPGSKK